jgi:hypothetical protein
LLLELWAVMQSKLQYGLTVLPWCRQAPVTTLASRG